MSNPKKSGGKFRSLDGFGGAVSKVILTLIPIACILYVADVQTHLGFQIYKEQYLGIFIALFLAAVFLNVPAVKSSSRDRVPWYDWILVIISLVIFGNVMLFYRELVVMVGFAAPKEVIMGFLAVYLLFEAARRIIGLPLVIIGLILVLYARFAFLFPGLLNARGVSWKRLFTMLYLDPNSILGVPSSVAGTMVVAFLLFGVCLFMVGGGEFLSDIAMALMGRQRGGAAKVAVIASGLFGSLSGSASANVAVTGAVTIPLMKKTGYSPPFSAAVEAVASTGGLVMPPVMGITAFMMAEFLGMPYYEVALAAAIPAVLYYVALLVQVHWEAVASGIEGLPAESLPRISDVLKKGWFYAIPVAGLLYFLFVMHADPSTAAVYASGMMVAVGLFKKEVRSGFGLKILKALQETGLQVLVVGSACSMAGIVIGSVSLTNLGLNLSNTLIAVSGGSSLLLLVLAAAASIILGMGMPIAATYIMLVILIAPAMTHAGIPAVAAHMFMNFFAAMSFVTPPVAIAAYVAAGIAQCEPMKAGFIATRLGIGAYLVPFCFCYSPGLLLIGSPGQVIYSVFPATFGVLTAAVCLSGFLFSRLSPLERVIFGISAAGLLSPVSAFQAVGFVLAAGGAAWSWRKKRAFQPSREGYEAA
ncbi:MAG: TRAP transporter fused permease subunit [Desulfobacteraceae bacterium]|nr:MAG: TRAP transporter fused permease subunit [Desulfobacteraceae bacterium]